MHSHEGSQGQACCPRSTEAAHSQTAQAQDDLVFSFDMGTFSRVIGANRSTPCSPLRTRPPLGPYTRQIAACGSVCSSPGALGFVAT